MFDKDRQRVTEELESVVAELRAEGVLQEEVSVHDMESLYTPSHSYRTDCPDLFALGL